MELCCGGEPMLLLILGASPHTHPWAEAAAALRGLPLRACHILPGGVEPPSGPGGDDGGIVDGGGGGKVGGGTASAQGLTPHAATFIDVHGQWQKVREVPEHGAVLVRPDGHVAWRSRGPAPPPEQCVQQLRAAVQAVMCL